MSIRRTVPIALLAAITLPVSVAGRTEAATAPCAVTSPTSLTKITGVAYKTGMAAKSGCTWNASSNPSASVGSNVVSRAAAAASMSQKSSSSMKVTDLKIDGHKAKIRSHIGAPVLVTVTADLGDKGIQLILIGGRDGVKGDPAAAATAILNSIISKAAGIAPS